MCSKRVYNEKIKVSMYSFCVCAESKNKHTVFEVNMYHTYLGYTWCSSKSFPLGAWWTSVLPDGPLFRYGLFLSFLMPAFYHSSDICRIFTFLWFSWRPLRFVVPGFHLVSCFMASVLLKQSCSLLYLFLHVSPSDSSHLHPLGFFLHLSLAIGLLGLLCPLVYQLKCLCYILDVASPC